MSAIGSLAAVPLWSLIVRIGWLAAVDDKGRTMYLRAMKALAIALAALMMTSCHEKTPPSCGGSPPEDDRQYDAWSQAQKDAHCDVIKRPVR